METKVNNREWVKNAAIIFLAVLLVLTFFSNTIMNRSLPEVASAPVQSGNIVAKVRGTGTVTANGNHQVKATETRTIRAVMVKVGQEVNAGDVLFVLGEGDATELEQARETLRNMQTSYQKSALSIPTFNYNSYNRAIENAKRARDRATEEREAAEAKRDQMITDPITKAALLRYEAADKKAKELEQEYAEERETKTAELTKELESLYANLSAAQDAVANDPAVVAAQSSYNEAVENYEAESAALALLEADMNDKWAYYEALTMSSETEDAPYEVFKSALDAYEQAKTLYNAQAAVVQSAEAAMNMAENDLTNATEAASATVYALTSEIAAKEMELASLDEDVHYAAVREAIEERDRLYNEYYAMAGPIEEEYQRAVRAEEDAQSNLEATIDDLAYAQEQNERSVQSAYIDLASLAEQIKLQQEKIKSLAGDEENVITAKVSGTVETVECTAGDTVLKDKVLCTMEVPDMGHTLSFSVTNDQAQRLRIGDTATVSNYYWGNSVTATLTTIRTDPKNPQTNKVLTFDLEGDVTTGAELTISVGQKSANYDLIVPNSAIKSDSNGSFVLAVSAKSSPLGNRYSARRVSIEVLASDDNNSAVVADLYNGDYVITTSSAPLKSGDLVRLADNG